MLTPELDENTERLTSRARALINAEFRNLLWEDVSKKIRASQLRDLSPEPQSASKVSKAVAVKTARKKIRDEWKALKDATIISNESPENRLSDVLLGVVVYIEINNVPKSTALTFILQSMGATVSDKFTPVVTHVVFKRGTRETFQRAKLLNVYLVSVLWIEACRNSRKKIPEELFPVPNHSDYASPRACRLFMEDLGSEERKNLMERALRRVTEGNPKGPPQVEGRRVTRSSVNTDSSESTLDLHISSDDSGKKINQKHSNKDKATTKVLVSEDTTKKKRRLFASAGDEVIDHDGNKKKKLDEKLKRKLFTQNRLDDTTLNTSTSSEDTESSTPTFNLKENNPYQIPGNPRTVRKKVQPKEKLQTKKLNRKEISDESDDEESFSDGGARKSNLERREQVRELIKMTQTQSGTVKKPAIEKKRRLIKEKKKKKLTKEERENLMKANKIARREQNQIVKASQPRSCKKVNINYSKPIRTPSLVSTYLHRTENSWLKECLDMLGGFTFKAAVEADTTHVVAGGPVRTINLLKGLSRGCWLLDKRWVEDSARAGHWLSEHDYELNKFSPAVQKCRIERQTLGSAYRLDVFGRCGGVHVGGACGAGARQLRALVALCGGRAAPAERADVVVGERRDGRRCVDQRWVLDSVAAGRCRSLNKYLIA